MFPSEPPIQLIFGDCLEKMALIQEDSVDMVMADLPYGTTACPWDVVIPFEPLWAHLRRICRKNAPIVLTGSQPFTSLLVASNIANFKYEWIYEKTNPKGFLSASHRPLTAHENILVFCYETPPYYPQKWIIPDYLRTRRKHATAKTSGECYGNRKLQRWEDDGSRFPVSVIGFSNRVDRENNFHPTQKPLALIEYLISTYTLRDQLVLDCTMGSGTTGVACRNLGRRFIGIESDPDIFRVAQGRVDRPRADFNLPQNSQNCE